MTCSWCAAKTDEQRPLARRVLKAIAEHKVGEPTIA